VATAVAAVPCVSEKEAASPSQFNIDRTYGPTLF
jgi:hypothetical protein